MTRPMRPGPSHIGPDRRAAENGLAEAAAVYRHRAWQCRIGPRHGSPLNMEPETEGGNDNTSRRHRLFGPASNGSSNS